MLKFLAGIGTGIGIGLIIAPAAGRETRRQLLDAAKDPTGAVRDQVQQARQKAGDIGANLGRQAAQQAVDKVIPEKLNERRAR
jgi:gas vesicle protein